jgi:hypothetical protein
MNFFFSLLFINNFLSLFLNSRRNCNLATGLVLSIINLQHYFNLINPSNHHLDRSQSQVTFPVEDSLLVVAHVKDKGIALIK